MLPVHLCTKNKTDFILPDEIIPLTIQRNGKCCISYSQAFYSMCYLLSRIFNYKWTNGPIQDIFCLIIISTAIKQILKILHQPIL